MVKIVLLKGTTTVGTIAESVSIGSGGKGSYAWSSWSGRVPGSDYKVSVQSTNQPTIKDISNNYFIVTAGTTTSGTTISGTTTSGTIAPSTTPAPVSTPNTNVVSGSSSLNFS